MMGWDRSCDTVLGDIDVATMLVGGVIGGSVVHCSQQPRQVDVGVKLCPLGRVLFVL